MNALFPVTEVSAHDLAARVHAALARPGWRFGHQTARAVDSGTAGGQYLVEVLLLEPVRGTGEILSGRLAAGDAAYPAVTTRVPAAHWAERALGDLHGLRAVGHPRWKSAVLHEAWSPRCAPLRPDAGPDGCSPAVSRDLYAFMEVAGVGVHEIPVGPIHAGIIEPGHFRFSCLGEIITNLEIRLGYQHRGIERRLTQAPLPQARFVAEAASSDTAAGNALAHAVAVEQMLGLQVPPRAEALRTLALEIERVAAHLGDFGGLSADMGYSAGASIFARLRGMALGLGECLTGTRLQRAYILPGGVTRDLDAARRATLSRALVALAKETRRSLPVVLENPAALERMEGVGVLSASLAREFGLVGPAARASGSDYDARAGFRHALHPLPAFTPAREPAGDVLARARLRAAEVEASLQLLASVTATLPAGDFAVSAAETWPANRVGIGIVEAWRGELIHWITTDAGGQVRRYAIKDPSFNNWTGLAIAARGNLVADFPLCNKSFNLSYSGADL